MMAVYKIKFENRAVFHEVNLEDEINVIIFKISNALQITKDMDITFTDQNNFLIPKELLTKVLLKFANSKEFCLELKQNKQDAPKNPVHTSLQLAEILQLYIQEMGYGHLFSKGELEDSDRINFVRATTDHLVKEYGYYPLKNTKVLYAKALSHLTKLPEAGIINYNDKRARGWLEDRLIYLRLKNGKKKKNQDKTENNKEECVALTENNIPQSNTEESEVLELNALLVDLTLDE